MRRPAQPSLKKLLEDDNLIIMRIRCSLRATESCISVRQPPKLHKVLKLRLIDPRNAKLEGNLGSRRANLAICLIQAITSTAAKPAQT